MLQSIEIKVELMLSLHFSLTS